MAPYGDKEMDAPELQKVVNVVTAAFREDYNLYSTKTLKPNRSIASWTVACSSDLTLTYAQKTIPDETGGPVWKAHR